MNYETNARKPNSAGGWPFVFLITIMALCLYLLFVWNGGSARSLREITVSQNKSILIECFRPITTDEEGWTWTDSEIYRQARDCWQTKRMITPDDLFLTVPKYLVDEGKCSISQGEDDHVRPERWGMYATDLACNFKEQGVYAPDYLGEMVEYTIEATGSDNLLGSFVILSFPNSLDKESWKTRWYFGHTVLNDWWEVGDIVLTWKRFARADLSWATTGWHTHIELRRMYDGVWQSIRYVTRFKERKLEEKRFGTPDGGGSWTTNISSIISSKSWNWKDVKYYFTHYDLWDTSQNDSTPCIWADGKDSCQLAKHGRGTMAITVDIRKSMGINFWDKVALTGDVWCEGVYTVTDEMACRFRGTEAWSNGPCYYSDKITLAPKNSNVLRPGTPYFIKWDLPGRPGGACSISKL